MLGYVEESVVNDIFIQIDDLYKMINATIKTLKEKYIDH